MKNEVKVMLLNDEYGVIVCWGNPGEIGRTLHRHGYPKDERHMDEEWNARGHCFYSPGLCPVVALPDMPKTATQMGTLAHEATHAALHVLDIIGATIDGEVLAHSVGAIVRNTLKYIEKRIST